MSFSNKNVIMKPIRDPKLRQEVVVLRHRIGELLEALRKEACFPVRELCRQLTISDNTLKIV